MYVFWGSYWLWVPNIKNSQCWKWSVYVWLGEGYIIFIFEHTVTGISERLNTFCKRHSRNWTGGYRTTYMSAIEYIISQSQRRIDRGLSVTSPARYIIIVLICICRNHFHIQGNYERIPVPRLSKSWYFHQLICLTYLRKHVWRNVITWCVWPEIALASS